MLNRGYTAQAATISSALFENALAGQCISGSDKRANQLNSEGIGKVPWDVAAMYRIVARIGNSAPLPTDWEPLYAQYVWLCQIKHPTMAQTIHDAGATACGQSGYAVMALPDVRDEDLGAKKLLCMIVLSEALRAIESFATFLV